MNFGIAKIFGAIDKVFQDKYNYLIDLLSSFSANTNTSLDLKMNLVGGSTNPFAAMPYVGTAPIVERGNNSNGAYIKYADGTMFCYHSKYSEVGNTANGALWVSTPTSWTFPVAFYEAPNVWSFVRNYVAGANPLCVSRASGSAVTTTAVGKLFVWYVSSSASAQSIIDVFAIGKWKA